MAMSKSKVEAIYPLTFTQQSFLHHHLYEEIDHGYIHNQCKIKGNLNIELFQSAWEKVIQRHTALRTSVHWENIKKAVQVVHIQANMNWNIQDWRTIPELEQEEKKQQFIEELLRKKTSLNKAPISQISLIRLTDIDYFFVWSIHHIVMDGYSTAMILKDVFDIYQDAEIDLHPTGSHIDYLKWVDSQDSDRLKHFWSNYLEGIDKPTLLKRQTSFKPSSLFKDYHIQLSRDEAVQIETFGRQNRLTVHSLIKGIWALLIRKYTNQQDIIFGTVSTGRTTDYPNISSLAGLLAKLYPLRIRLEEEELTVTDWLASIQKEQMQIASYENVSLDQIMSWNPYLPHQLFDSLFVFEKYPWTGIKNEEIEFSGRGMFTSTYPFNFIVHHIDGISFQFRYQQGYISEEGIKWMSDNLLLLIQYILSNPTVSVKEICDQISDFKDASFVEEEIVEEKVEDRLHSYVAPSTPLELKLTKVWEEVLNINPIGVNDDFFELGGTSLLAIRLFGQIEKQLNHFLPPTILLENRTIKALSNTIEEKFGEGEIQRWSSIVPLKTKGNKAPLFCIHAGGAHVFYYSVLSKHLDREQPMYAVQPLGLDGNASGFTGIKDVAAHYIKEMQQIYPQGPYALLGYCLSTAICLEMSHQLHKAGETSSLLIVDSGPSVLDPIPIPPKNTLGNFFSLLQQGKFDTMKQSIQRRLYPIKEGLKNAFRSDQEKNLEKVRHELDLFYQQYHWEPYDGNKIILLRCKDTAENPAFDRHITQWEQLALKGLEVHVLDGNHKTIFDEPEVQFLAKQLTVLLNRENNENA